ncbi:hypothetical protein [Streptomyces sp. DSM 40907]|uniref:hypothetical protein n=1 Tax=Streptomyces kutzneri TaxID=3051179 RepID=UPI0028D8CACA|nr:hypothetical protein [Streptomyces sp. DSM 40907]
MLQLADFERSGTMSTSLCQDASMSLESPPKWAMWLLMPVALFYSFAVPLWVAGRQTQGGFGIAAAAIAMCLVFQVWALAVAWATEALCALYNAHPRLLHGIRAFFSLGRPSELTVNPVGAAVLAILSYGLSTYIFIVAYLFVSQHQASAFGVGKLNTFDAVYYGVATAFTYSDLQPVTIVAKSIVLIQLALVFVFALFLFSLIAGVIQSSRATVSGNEGQGESPTASDS